MRSSCRCRVRPKGGGDDPACMHLPPEKVAGWFVSARGYGQNSMARGGHSLVPRMVRPEKLSKSHLQPKDGVHFRTLAWWCGAGTLARLSAASIRLAGKSARSTFAQAQAPKVHAQKVMPGNCN